MIAGALAGGALATWMVAGVAARVRTMQVRRRLVVAVAVADDHHGHGRGNGSGSARPAGTRARRRAGGRGRRWRAASGSGSGSSVEALVASCDSIARSLRSGSSLSAAVAGAAAQHRHPALVEVARSIGLGVAVPSAIAQAARGPDDPDASLVLQVLAVGAEYGGAPAEAIDRAAATVREREALRAERRSQAASARLSARVMTVLPFGFTGFVAATDPGVRRILLTTPLGWTCLAIGAGLNLAGRAWTARAVAT